jgi:xanthine dehydrogenase accessory factor
MASLVDELIKIQEEGAAGVLATVVEADGGPQAGQKILIRDGRAVLGSLGDERLTAAVVAEAAERLKEEKSKLVPLTLPGGGAAEVFFEVLPAPPKLIIVGAGHIAVPLAKIAKILDFHVTVLDDRILFANRERFPDADAIRVGDMAEELKSTAITPSTYIVLLTRGPK